MIRVWSDGRPAGILDRQEGDGATFAYDVDADGDRAVSMTMPVRLASWNQPWGLHPVFEMNLPEGVLRERLQLDLAKATGGSQELDLLTVVGRSQIGRLRYTGRREGLADEVPFQSVDEILSRKRDGDLFAFMMERFARYSGIAGVQPKVMIRDTTFAAALGDLKEAKTRITGATHIVKFWDAAEYPHLAANEFFCLLAAEKAGLTVPRRYLSKDGAALVIDRFDLREDGTYCGIEDFCVLNGVGTRYKYTGAYEKMVFKQAEAFLGADNMASDLETLFTLFALNCALRNGDAHLKNFALIYDDVRGPARLAPVYDLVTTTAYLPKDAMALTLGGTTRWPDAKLLEKLGATRCRLTKAAVAGIFERVAAAMTEALGELRRHAAAEPGFREVAARMEQQWLAGIQHSLRTP